ncbi:MAG: IS4 family transposase, partial [Anaerolineales bacterium]|nr:IS4 family transposase [Anaerolineales bacterium]
MPINQLYHTWNQRIRELRPEQRITQVRNFVWLLIGIHQSRSVKLSRVAGKIPGSAKLVSTIRRLSRLLDNLAIRVRAWYAPIARQWLETQYRHLGEIRLVVDGTKIGAGHQLLIVCLVYRSRAIPIAWTWVKHVKGHSTGRKQLALLAYVRSLISDGAVVFLVGDCEFGSVLVLQQLDQWHWFYVLRQKSDTCVWFAEQENWKSFGSHIQKSGQSLWLGPGYLTLKEIYPVNLMVHWKRGEKEPWCLATNLPDRRLALRFYARRPWIEEMFGDFKRHGFDLEKTKLRHFQRLSRLTLAVAILYVWFISVGTRTIRSGLRHLVDRNDRRDLSVFQIGLRFIQRRLTNARS